MLHAMSHDRVIVRLKGGLGNQMFQYAAAAALARQHGHLLVADERSGFVRDKVYRRRYALDYFPVSHLSAKPLDRLPFYLEGVIDRYARWDHKATMRKRPWGTFFREQASVLYPELLHTGQTGDIWIDGYWQSERYFETQVDHIAELYQIPTPAAAHFLRLRDQLKTENAIAVGIRLYEEAPKGAHDYSPFTFVEQAARLLAAKISDPVFYLFCTVRKPIEDNLKLPGRTVYVTHDDGFKGEIEGLWLLSQFQTHIISHSSFYWWGAGSRSATSATFVYTPTISLNTQYRRAGSNMPNLHIPDTIRRLGRRLPVRVRCFLKRHLVYRVAFTRSLSQARQDLWLMEEVFPGKRNGFFIEIGSADGIALSNTCLLERRLAWRGVCVEANPLLFQGVDVQSNRHRHQHLLR